MVWQDLLFDRWIESRSLARALAAAFQIEPERVRVEDEIVPSLDVDGMVVLAERTRRHGDFPLQLGVYVRDDDLYQQLRDFDATVQLVRRLSQLTNSACLLSGDADEPEQDILVRPSGELLLVTLDEDRLDHDEFVVRALQPMAEVAGRRA